MNSNPDAVPTCQHCLANTDATPVASHLPQDQRCPVCGAAYTGPRRSAAFLSLRAVVERFPLLPPAPPRGPRHTRKRSVP